MWERKHPEGDVTLLYFDKTFKCGLNVSMGKLQQSFVLVEIGFVV